MAATPKVALRLSPDDRRLLREVAARHQRDQSDMIRVLIRAEHERLFRGPSAPAPAPASRAADPDDLPFDILEE
jgi:hypothetical protein